MTAPTRPAGDSEVAMFEVGAVEVGALEDAALTDCAFLVFRIVG